jgi:hypothetical protein
MEVFPGYWYKIEHLKVYRRSVLYSHYNYSRVVGGYMSQVRLNNANEVVNVHLDNTGKEIFPVPSHFSIEITCVGIFLITNISFSSSAFDSVEFDSE